MNDAEKPPLGSLAYERIAQLLHKVDKERWPKIAAFRISTFIPLSDPVPPHAPGLLLTEIREYASDLFKTEADHYQGFANDPRYRKWLSELEVRVLARVVDALEKIDKADPKMILMAHGLEHLPMVESLRERLWELGRDYASNRSRPVPPSLVAEPQSTQASEEPSSSNRERIDNFIRKMASAGLRINRKDIWRTAGYSDRTEFERFQRGESRNKTASSNFSRILNLSADDFRSIRDRKA